MQKFSIPPFFFGISTMVSPQRDNSDPNPPRFPSVSSMFPTGDGFTPHGVSIHCFLSSLTKEEKNECHEFMEPV